MMGNQNKNMAFVVPILMGLMLAGGIWVGTLFDKGDQLGSSSDSTSNKFNTIIDMIEEKYVDSVNHEQLMESSIDGMISKLDPHSAYISAKDLMTVNEQLDGEFGGIGIRFLVHEDSLVATHVIGGSPAERAGMLPRDRIVEVDGVDITADALTNEKVMKMLKGNVGSDVEVKVNRKEGETKLRIQRGVIPISSIDAAIMLSSDIGFIKLNSFTHKAAQEFEEAAKDLKRQGMQKLIFDLRNNGGGLMFAATDIVDHFLKSGKLIVYTEGRKSPKAEYTSSSNGILEDVEVIVLINSLSASASEIVAGAIQDNDRGLIMGRRSFGKGLVQDQQELMDGSALRLTISRYYTPSGRSIQKPYGMGVDYENDYYNRMETGELLNEDSVHVDKSLEYLTTGGRTVYGGGGIYPDLFIPNDTAGASYYLTNLYYAGAFNHFAIRYLDQYSERFRNFDTFFKGFDISDALFADFINYARNMGVEPDAEDIKTSKEVIKNRIKAEFARHIWNENGYYRVYIQDDMDVSKARDKFLEGAGISQLLSGEK